MTDKIKVYTKGIKDFNHYSIKEIKIGHKVQINRIKDNRTKLGDSLSLHFEVQKIDPKGTGKIIGRKYIPFGEKELGMFFVNQIYRNYSLDPVVVKSNSYKGKTTEFKRKPL